jgi:hypothetical protein
MNAPTTIAVYIIFIILSLMVLYSLWLFISKVAILLGLTGFSFWLSTIVLSLMTYSILGSTTYNKISNNND